MDLFIKKYLDALEKGETPDIETRNEALLYMLLKKSGGTSGGPSVQSDLAQNDETAADYVKNRTHYAMPPAFEPITWDGNTEGRDSFSVAVTSNITAVYYKVSDVIFSASDVDGGSLTMTTISDSSTQTMPLTKGETFEDVQDTDYGVYCTMYCQCVHRAGTVAIMGVEVDVLSTGTYFMFMEGQGYTSRIEGLETVKKLDPKYLPMDYINENIDSLPEQSDSTSGAFLRSVDGVATWVQLTDVSQEGV